MEKNNNFVREISKLHLGVNIRTVLVTRSCITGTTRHGGGDIHVIPLEYKVVFMPHIYIKYPQDYVDMKAVSASIINDVTTLLKVNNFPFLYFSSELLWAIAFKLVSC